MSMNWKMHNLLQSSPKYANSIQIYEKHVNIELFQTLNGSSSFSFIQAMLAVEALL